MPKGLRRKCKRRVLLVAACLGSRDTFLLVEVLLVVEAFLWIQRGQVKWGLMFNAVGWNSRAILSSPMDFLSDCGWFTGLKACNTTIPYHVYLYGYVIRAGSACCVFVQLDTKCSTVCGETRKLVATVKQMGMGFLIVMWSNLLILGSDGADKRYRSHSKRRE